MLGVESGSTRRLGPAVRLVRSRLEYHKLGEPARAGDFYTLANRWVDSRSRREQLTSDHQEEVSAVRAEVEQVLAVETNQP